MGKYNNQKLVLEHKITLTTLVQKEEMYHTPNCMVLLRISIFHKIVLIHLAVILTTMTENGMKDHRIATLIWPNVMILKYATKKWDLDYNATILQMADVVCVVHVHHLTVRDKSGFQWV